MAHKIVVEKLKKKDAKLSDMFSWCAANCSKEYGADGAWGSSWWTEKNNTEFHFVDARDAVIFSLTFS